MKYRLYIDETGNHDLESAQDPNYRYLGLAGIAIDLKVVREILMPNLEQLKQDFFPYDPDSPPIFHRKKLETRRYPFHTLNDSTVEQAFYDKLFEFLQELDFTVMTVAIDKLEHKNRYRVWMHQPYHYCLEVLIERYVLFLENREVKGDVLAESRVGPLDIKLKQSFSRIFKDGTDYISAQRIQQRLTSKELKVEPKFKNISGLQLADLIAHPSKQDILFEQRRINSEGRIFAKRMIQLLNKSKYYRSPEGLIDGYGKKLLP